MALVLDKSKASGAFFFSLISGYEFGFNPIVL